MSDLEPITREETAWVNGDLEPITRKEKYIKHLYDETQEIPDPPQTREEWFIKKAGEEIHDVTIEPLTATDNGTYSESGKAYSPVTVAVPLGTKSITANGTYNATDDSLKGYSSVSVDVPLPDNGYLKKDLPTGTIATVTDAEAEVMPSLKIAITPVQSGSGDPSPSNVRPISGWSGAEVSVRGVNQWDEEYNFKGINALTGEVGTWNDRLASANYIPVKSLKEYFISTPVGSWYIHCYNNNKAWLGRATTQNGEGYVNKSGAFVTLTNTAYIKFSCTNNAYGTTYNNNISINYPSTDTSYHAYTGQDYSIPFPSEAGTVYGGTLDVETGVLTVTQANIASYDGETLPGAWISDRDVYAEGTTPTTGAQVVYDLDTPQTYQLSPTAIKTLLNTNNIFADTGDILDGEYWSKNPVTVTQAMLSTLRDAGEVTEITPTEETEEADER